ncbi:RloB family protein [Corynebacterium durum]|uniref:RloB family protein n=1 Tax=Corynebacterium durum TaxID=61592 RepID=UPI002888FF92|nr:RloB family protein [Corynebacterium durum]
MAPRKQKRRGKKGVRQQLPVILICCQGTVTEVEYFSNYKQSLRAPHITIESRALDPIKLAKHALTLAKRGSYDEVYIVVDVDDSTSQEFDQAIAFCRKNTTKKHEIHMVISNPCFDLWLYLHKKPLPQQETDRKVLSCFLEQQEFLYGKPPKHVSSAFDCSDPSGALREASKQPLDLDELGPNPSTSVPHLVLRIKSTAQQRRK